MNMTSMPNRKGSAWLHAVVLCSVLVAADVVAATPSGNQLQAAVKEVYHPHSRDRTERISGW